VKARPPIVECLTRGTSRRTADSDLRLWCPFLLDWIIDLRYSGASPSRHLNTNRRILYWTHRFWQSWVYRTLYVALSSFTQFSRLTVIRTGQFVCSCKLIWQLVLKSNKVARFLIIWELLHSSRWYWFVSSETTGLWVIPSSSERDVYPDNTNRVALWCCLVLAGRLKVTSDTWRPSNPWISEFSLNHIFFPPLCLYYSHFYQKWH
jgi:hypothetical protein